MHITHSIKIGPTCAPSCAPSSEIFIWYPRTW